MKSIWTFVLLSLFSTIFSIYAENESGWNTYLSYQNTQQVEESADQVFVVAEGSLYTYGKEDNSIKQYYKGNGLSDTHIQWISYNKKTQSLLIVYQNGNIDLWEKGIVKNIPYLYTTTALREKTVNSIFIHNQYAYLSIQSGIVVINMEKKEITDTYHLSKNITSCTIWNGHLYASVYRSTQLLTASLQDNLLDSSNWKSYSIADIPTDLSIDKVVTFQNQLIYLIKKRGVYSVINGSSTPLVSHPTLNQIELIGNQLACLTNTQTYLFHNLHQFDQINQVTLTDISTYQIDCYWIAEGAKGVRSIRKRGANQFDITHEPIVLDGPYTNCAFQVVCQNDKVYLIPGGKELTNGSRFGKAGSIMIYDYKKWQVIEPKTVQNKLKVYPRDYTSIVIQSLESGDEIIYASSFGDGIIQYKNGEPVALYNQSNSPIQNAGGYTSRFCFMDGLALDKEGNLWMTNSEASKALKVLDNAGKWHSLSVESLNNKYTVNDILITSNNDKWINIARPNDQISLTVIAHDNTLDQVNSRAFKSFIDTDGNAFSPNNYTCMAEDKNGYIWVGTNKGAMYITNPTWATTDKHSSMRCSRVKLLDENETPYYFLDNVLITTIKVDHGNQKWIGTAGNGIYVLSSDNQEVIHQFNTTNSPLLSNQIYSIDINAKSGEVFIGTDKGLVSYKGDATEGRSDYSNVYAYPNPVRPNQADKVTITGLMDHSIVKITDLNGHLIFQTRSLGGQAVWNCKNANGNRVASGIYLVLSATEDSKESVVTKIAVIK